MKAVIGKKEGQSRHFNEDGSACAVTLVSISPNMISQIKTDANDGYNAIQISIGSKKNLNKPMIGHLKKAKVESARMIKEFRVSSAEGYELGQAASLEWLDKIKSVDVSGVNKGKGFAGVVKRHHFKTQDASHGNSLAHRAPGSIGQCQDPGRVFKGKKMAGRMGGVNVTQQNVKVVDYIQDKSILVLKGSIPGAVGGYVVLKPTIKIKAEKNER
ncbi:MAG: 50S ribosomal protein L3 [Legionellales bacterium]|nr:50S ribosomal protein L3 [Legionellales bacterium]OUX64309.1 MAG: 50S ribosomal protein L3 [Gammaproteobacteria bacterium TMED281]|tara:strand:+ start:381 stop:1025 length:645 start_codon:yes stop_codon:yes gene_type:complete